MLETRMTQEDRDLLRYAVSVYGFIYVEHTETTAAAFAAEIEKVYDRNEPHTAHICTTLRKYPDTKMIFV